MSIFEKMGLVERVPKQKEHEYPDTSGYVYEEYAELQPEIEVEKITAGTVIEDIYAQNNLLDRSTSIFKVEEVQSSLPKEMVTETKRNTVVSIIGSFGLTAEAAVADGNQRLASLNVAFEAINQESEIYISGKTDEIEQHKQEIARLEKEIAAKRDETKITNEAIESEVKIISGLTEFVSLEGEII